MKYLDRLRESFHTSFECLNPTLSTLRVLGFTQRLDAVSRTTACHASLRGSSPAIGIQVSKKHKINVIRGEPLRPRSRVIGNDFKFNLNYWDPLFSHIVIFAITQLCFRSLWSALRFICSVIQIFGSFGVCILLSKRPGDVRFLANSGLILDYRLGPWLKNNQAKGQRFLFTESRPTYSLAQISHPCALTTTTPPPSSAMSHAYVILIFTVLIRGLFCSA